MMQNTANKIVRETAAKYGVRLWELGLSLGLSDSNFARKLRVELPESEQQALIQNIREIARMKQEN